MYKQSSYDHGLRREWLPCFAIFWIVISSIFVLLRLALRAAGRSSSLGFDDALLLPAWICYIAFTAVAIFSSNAGLIDRHTYDMRPSDYRLFAVTAWLSETLFSIGTCCLKLSVLLFFRRMVKDLFERKWHMAIWAAIWFTVVYTLVFVIILACSFSCIQQNASRDTAGPSSVGFAVCQDISSVVLAAGILSAISDTYAIFLPWAITRRLRLPIRQRLALNAIFVSSILIIVAACFRTTALVKFHRMQDPSWKGFETNVAAITEWGIGIICACIPSLRSFWRFCAGSYLGRLIRSKSREIQYENEHDANPSRLYQPMEPSDLPLTVLKAPSKALCR